MSSFLCPFVRRGLKARAGEQKACPAASALIPPTALGSPPSHHSLMVSSCQKHGQQGAGAGRGCASHPALPACPSAPPDMCPCPGSQNAPSSSAPWSSPWRGGKFPSPGRKSVNQGFLEVSLATEGEQGLSAGARLVPCQCGSHPSAGATAALCLSCRSFQAEFGIFQAGFRPSEPSLVFCIPSASPGALVSKPMAFREK